MKTKYKIQIRYKNSSFIETYNHILTEQETAKTNFENISKSLNNYSSVFQYDKFLIIPKSSFLSAQYFEYEE
jgi:hypothetical protein